MEKVQFQLEATLPELKDLESLNLFTKPELRQITLRRTKFESALIKRMARKVDFFEYADYEITLEKLRRTRWKRLGYDKNPPPRSVSTHSIQRRVVYILRRATQKFPHDLGVWMAYVDYARGEGMSKVVGSGLTSALQLHPLASVLYILLSQHYLSPLSPIFSTTTTSSSPTPPTSTFSIENVSPARKTLLIGLRLLPTDQTLWREYIRLEIGWVEALRRRWKVLGIEADSTDVGKGQQQDGLDLQADIEMGLPSSTENENEDENGTETDPIPDLGLNAFGESGESARKAIMRGDLVLTVLRSSFSNPILGSDLTYHLSLLNMFRDYPTGLRTRLLDAVYENIDSNEVLRSDARARRISAERGIYDRVYTSEEEVLTWPETEGWEREGGEDVPVLNGSELLIELGRSVGNMKRWKPEEEQLEDAWREEIGLWLIKWMRRVGEDASIAYLAGELKPLLQARARPSAELLTAYLAFLSNLISTDPSSSLISNTTKIQSQLNEFTSLHPTSSALWASRIALETDLDRDESVRSEQLRRSYLAAMDALGATKGAAEIWEDAMEFFDELLHEPNVSPLPTDGMKSHWKHALSAARRYTFESKYSREVSEELYSHLLGAWTASRLDLFEDELEPTRLLVLDAVLTEVLGSGAWDPPVSYFPTLFEAVAGASTQTTETEVRLRRVFSAWMGKASASENRVEAVLAWAQWLVLGASARGAEAWTAVETLQKQLEAQGARAEGDVARLKAGWTDILSEAEARKESVEVGEEAVEEDDVSMELHEDADMDI